MRINKAFLATAALQLSFALVFLLQGETPVILLSMGLSFLFLAVMSPPKKKSRHYYSGY